jgi:tetratricopeptide (TPR) repeat protein
MIRSKWMVVAVWLVGCSRLSVGPDPAGSVAGGPPPVAPSASLVEPDPPAPIAPGQGTAPSESQVAALLQRSYDEEAAGKLEPALAALDGVHATTRTAYVLALRRGWLLYRLAKYDDSVTEYGRAAALAPDAVEARVGSLAPLAAARRWNDVEAAARDVLAKDPANYSATLRLAFALYSQARFGDAEATYRRLAALYPGDVEVRGGLAWSLLKMGRARDAAAEFAAVLAVAPQNKLALDGAKAAGAAPERR